MYREIRQAIGDKIGQDIVIIGKGPSIDGVDLSLIEDCIVINTNDSEIIYPGDIAVFHHEWVLNAFDDVRPQCKLYITDKALPKDVNQLTAEYIPNNPESVNFLINRFFSETIYIEHAMVISALRIANEIAHQEGIKKNVYLLGFDFSRKDGFTSKIPSANQHNDPDYQERIISSQEQVLEMLLTEKKRLSINVKHVGNKQYSVYSVNTFNLIFSERHNKAVLQQTNLKFTKPLLQESIVKIVAEITTNHFGDMDRLKSMIIAAKKAGADFIKLQKRDVESFYSTEQLEAPYHSPFGKTFRDYRHGIELNRDQFHWVDSFCQKIGIDWFASILDMPSYEFILEFNPKIIKLPSTISEHKDYLRGVSKDFTKDVVISMGYTDEAFEEFVISNFSNVSNLYLLQCTSAYPTPNEDTQVGIVRHYYNLSKYNSRIIPGFSSHDVGSLCSMMAVSAGALMIEKHVKLGHVAWSHFDEVAIDLENGDFNRFVTDIRHAEKIVGGEKKIIQDSEHHKYWLKTAD
jgi:sialic acid synthase SpsE